MTYDLQIAIDGLSNMRAAFEPGSIVLLPNGAERIIVGPALHSETKQCMLIVYDEGTGRFSVIVLSAAKKTNDTPENINVFTKHITPQCWQHKNEEFYSSLITANSIEGEMTLYAAHKDATWWIRPTTMFNDGRFASFTSKPPMTIEQLFLPHLAA